jgi:hypothetical protein
MIELIEFRIGRVGPRARRIAALARRDGAIACPRERGSLCVPGVKGLGKAVQQQHERAVLRAVDAHVELHARSGRNLLKSHAITPTRDSGSSRQAARTPA